MQALGMIETKGFVASVEAIDTMLKTADVRLVALDKIGSSLLTACVMGEVAAVEQAVEAGCEHAKLYGDLIAFKVIPRPHEMIGYLLPAMVTYLGMDDDDDLA